LIRHQTSTIGKTILLFSIILVSLIIATTCASIDARTERSTGQIFLYGEWHGVPRIMDATLAGGSVERQFFRFSGDYYWYGVPAATGFDVD